nr:hypothetical protein [Brucella intermedia]
MVEVDHVTLLCVKVGDAVNTRITDIEICPDKSVSARSTRQDVGAAIAPAVQDVISVAAIQVIGSSLSDERVVPGPTFDQIVPTLAIK